MIWKNTYSPISEMVAIICVNGALRDTISKIIISNHLCVNKLSNNHQPLQYLHKPSSHLI